ncbi:Condensin complex subunit 2 [Habropoda laboriosa]|uniref:Condensin complex subunit 2 n=1 Tax=Habropoda laboriosa TaxID=597456 RepID=A0A0L7RK24_9HYME|nr:Condensin complex subunit 2 [Habropoda laboriosa]
MANIQSTPATSSSLRRKSVFTEKTVLTSALSENDDEAERLARRREINVESKSTTPLSGLSLNDRRRSLGISFLMQMPPSQMTERISQCIKLGTENKINPKNAFSLEMIDFMIYMIKKKDANMCNLQVASTSLDVSTKIYGFRVDGIHMEVLKMMGGIDKQDNGGGNKNNFEDINSQKDTEDNQNKEKREKKKKKKCKQVFTTVEALKINVETEKPSLITMEADSLTTNMLYQVMLPNHANSKFYPHSYNDILVDTVNGKDSQDNDTTYKCAEYFQVENIVDFRKVLTKTSPPKVSEYSFIQKNFNIHWAGPSHWKVSNFRKALSNSKVIETCRQAPMRKRKEIELCYNDETIKSVNSKFLPSQMVKLHNKTVKNEWKEEGLVLPPDEHYDIIQANKLYHHTTTFKHLENTDNMNATSLSNEMEDYNYENEIPNCVPNKHGENETNDVIDNGIISENGHMLGTQIAFTGNNLVTIPKFTNKLTIAYSVHAKKIDMKQLKHSIWKCLKGTKHKTVQETATAEAMQQDENLKMNDSKHFSDIYKELPNVLTKTNMEALSFPIAFVSLLHLANEKTLRISSSSDMADLIIEQN